MAAIQDRDYLRLCAELASCLSISQAAARRRVEYAAAQEGVRDVEARKRLASQLLDEARVSRASEGEEANPGLDALLAASPGEDRFMLED